VWLSNHVCIAAQLSRLRENGFVCKRQPPVAKEAAEELPVLGRSSARRRDSLGSSYGIAEAMP